MSDKETTEATEATETTEATEATEPVKPGWKSSEFILTIVADFLGLLMMSGVVGDNWIAKVIGAVVALLATLGYTAARTKVKGK